MPKNFIKSIAKAEYLATMELAGRVCAELADRIDRALATNDREILRENGFIPPHAQDLDAELERSTRVLEDSFEETKRMMTDVGRAFADSDAAQEFLAQRISKMRQDHQAGAYQKASIITDVHTGTGPLSPHTVHTLAEMREVARAVADVVETFPYADVLDRAFPHLDDERYQPIGALILMTSIEMTRASAQIANQVTGSWTPKHPLPSAEDIAALRDFAAAHDDQVMAFMTSIDPPRQDENEVGSVSL